MLLSNKPKLSLVFYFFLFFSSSSFAGHHWEVRRMVESLNNLGAIYENLKTLDDFINVSSRLSDNDIKGAIAVYGDDKLSARVDKTDAMLSDLKKEKDNFKPVEIASFPAVLLVSMEARVEYKDTTSEELSNWKKVKNMNSARIAEHQKAVNFAERCKKEADIKSNYMSKLEDMFDTKSESFSDKVAAGMTAALLWNELPTLFSAQTQWNEISSNCSGIKSLADLLNNQYKSNQSNIDLNIKSFSELLPE